MRFLIAPALAISILGFVGCKTQEIESPVLQTPIIIDGDLDDWQGMPFTSDEDDNAALAIGNDDSCLYAAVKFRDPMWLRTIRMKGLTIWVNNEAKKDKTIGFRFNGGPGREEMEKLRPQAEQASEVEGQLFQKKDMMTNFDSIETRLEVLEKDFWYQPTPIEQDGRNGPEVAFGMGAGMFWYEYKIPLAPSAGKFYGAGLESSQPFLLCLEWGGIERGDHPRGGMRLTGTGIGGEGMGGGMPGDGPPPGGDRRGGMSRGDFEKYMKKQDFWVKIALAPTAKE